MLTIYSIRCYFTDTCYEPTSTEVATYFDKEMAILHHFKCEQYVHRSKFPVLQSVKEHMLPELNKWVKNNPWDKKMQVSLSVDYVYEIVELTLFDHIDEYLEKI